MTKRRTAAAESMDEQAAENTTFADATSPVAESVTPQGEEQESRRLSSPVRGWRHRNNDPRYSVQTDARIKKIIIKFPLDSGQQKPADEVLDVMRAHKTNADGSSTGLRFEDNRLHGKAWTLPNDQEGRAVLAAIEVALEKIASKTPSVPERGA
jgi:hypothetical protein